MAQVKVIMPQMGESVAEGTVAKWLKKPGDRVEKDENILEISTDKIDAEIPAPASGFLTSVIVEEGRIVEVGTALAIIADTMEEVEGEPLPAETATPEATEAEVVEPTAEPERTVGEKSEPAAKRKLPENAVTGDKRKFYTPVVLRMAAEHGVELDQVEGTGMGGRITKKDLLEYIEERGRKPEAAAAEPPAAARPATTLDGGEEVVPMSNVRKRTAEHMIRSKQTSAHVTSMHEVDLTRVVRFRESIKEEFKRKNGFPLTYLSIITKETVETIQEYPTINSSVDGDNIVIKRYINIGIAVALPDDTLIVPVIHNAADLSVQGIARAIYDFSEKARSRKLALEDIQGGTFTITNHGSFGSVFGTPIIHQPQVAILGTGSIRKRPVVVGDDAIAVRHTMFLSLTYDHRIIDGAYAGRFCRRLAERLENWDQRGF